MEKNGKSPDVFEVPNGWAIKTYRYLTISPTDFLNSKEIFESMSKNVQRDPINFTNEPSLVRPREISFGNYDRIQPIPINDFSEFAEESSKSYDWYGSTQTILLFPLEKDFKKRPFFQNKNEKVSQIFVRKGNNYQEPQGFFAVTFCYITDEARNQAGTYNDLLKKCNRAITSLVDAYNLSIDKEQEESGHRIHEHVVAETFGSFSSAEIVILWSSKQYSDIMYLTDCIPDFRLYDDQNSNNDFIKNDNESSIILFRKTFTMISYPGLTLKYNKPGKDNVSEIQGKAQIQFVMQGGVGEDKYDKFKEYLIQSLDNANELIGCKDFNSSQYVNEYLKKCIGEFDAILDIDGKFLPILFNEQHAPNNSEQNNNYDFSVHNQSFNKYVLCSSTRLSYSEIDIPKFARSSGKKSKEGIEWRKRKQNLVRISIDVSKQVSSLPTTAVKRSSIIKRIESDRKKKFKDLLDLVDIRLPFISNLSTELKQLYSDYVQCCSSSADYSWIKDYDTLFQETLEKIHQMVERIDVWQQYNWERKNTQDWDNGRESLGDVSKLISALHQQTCHIMASNKLFFKEQYTHFGYTAQHDLVIHAYYDIIKHLIEYIYFYTHEGIQSSLYPLVNFCPENRITSAIYTEESASIFWEKYRKGQTKELGSRIMLLNIPLDGMNNLMHYLPMLVHETYHYAAPLDRQSRNLVLAKISIYIVLKKAFSEIFKEIVFDEFTDEKEDPDKTNRVNDELADERDNLSVILKIKEIRHYDQCTLDLVCSDFIKILDSVLFYFLNEKGNAIFEGLKLYFFSESNASYNNDLIENAPILRNWFLLWLQNWLQDMRKRKLNQETQYVQKNEFSCYENFTDLLPDLFHFLYDALSKHPQNEEDHSTYGTIFQIAISKLLYKISLALALEENTPDQDGLYQIIASKASEYIIHKDLDNVWENLDELFPDLAMITLMNMTPSEYMLQTALDLDKQLYHGRSYPGVSIRYGSILQWMINLSGSKDSDPQHTLKNAIEDFKKMYLSSYQLFASSKSKETMRYMNEKRAEEWIHVFSDYYFSISNENDSSKYGMIRKWIQSLLKDFSGCLQLDTNSQDAHQKLFIDPYKNYTNILRKGGTKTTHGTLFTLSINTIQGFQRYRPLCHINKEFHKKTLMISQPFQLLLPYHNSSIVVNDYISRLESVNQYFSNVPLAIMKLSHYRDIENLPSTPGMWYRGGSHSEYPILPSGFVHFSEDAGRLQKDYPKCAKPCSYIHTQLHNYETFRYSVEGANKETDPSRYYNTINYLTLMQHYSQHTNLLDWSEDIFASTYFALEDEINVNDHYDHERSNRDKCFSARNADAALYILDPVRFNKACDEIEARKLFNVRSLSALSNTVQTSIPNLSIDENQGLYKEYLNLYSITPENEGILRIKPVKGRNGGVSLIDLENSGLDKCLNMHLPRAIYAAKLNARIRAQSGLFIAFSILSKPILWEGDDEDKLTIKPSPELFYYQSLESIQAYYQSISAKNNPFLFKIIIPASMKEELGLRFYQMGISKERIYPELQNYRNR